MTQLNIMYLKVRDLIQDGLTPDYYVEEYINSKIFTLPDATVDSSTVKVYKNQTLVINVSGDVKYTFDAQTSRLIFENSYTLAAGDIIEVYYSAYKKFTSAEIRQYIRAAIIRLSVKKYQTFVLKDDDVIFPTPVETDENLICLIASILMEGNVSSYRTNEVQIMFAKDEDNEERIRIVIREFKKAYGIFDYVNTRRPFTIYVEDSDMTLENLP